MNPTVNERLIQRKAIISGRLRVSLDGRLFEDLKVSQNGVIRLIGETKVFPDGGNYAMTMPEFKKIARRKAREVYGNNAKVVYIPNGLKTINQGYE